MGMFTREDVRSRLLPIALGQAAGLAVGITGVSLVTRWIDPADYGVYGVFVSLVPLGYGVIFIGLVKFVSRHWRETTDRRGLARDIFGAFGRKLAWLVGAAIIAAWFAPAAERGWFGAALGFSAIVMGVVQLGQAALQAERAHWRDCAAAIGISSSRSLLPPLFYVATGLGVRAMLLGFCVHALVALASVRAAVRLPGHLPPGGMRPRLTADYAGQRFVVLALVNWALLGINRWVVAAFFGTETAGYFTLASNIGFILPAMFGAMLLQLRQPVWFEQATAGNPRTIARDVDRLALLYTVAALGATLVLRAAMPWLTGTLVSARYGGATEFVLATGLFVTSVTLGGLYHALLIAVRQEAACTRADFAGATVLIGGVLLAAWAGLDWLKWWLLASPAVPWLVNRRVARAAVLRADER